jgi:hypothetical protein
MDWLFDRLIEAFLTVGLALDPDVPWQRSPSDLATFTAIDRDWIRVVPWKDETIGAIDILYREREGLTARYRRS